MPRQLPDLTPKQAEYADQLAQDTWDSIDQHSRDRNQRASGIEVDEVFAREAIGAATEEALQNGIRAGRTRPQQAAIEALEARVTAFEVLFEELKEAIVELNELADQAEA